MISYTNNREILGNPSPKGYNFPNRVVVSLKKVLVSRFGGGHPGKPVLRHGFATGFLYDGKEFGFENDL